MPPKRKNSKGSKTGTKRKKVSNFQCNWGLLIEAGDELKGRIISSGRRKREFTAEEIRKHIGCDMFSLLAMGESKLTGIDFEIYVDDEAMLKRENQENKLLIYWLIEKA